MVAADLKRLLNTFEKDRYENDSLCIRYDCAIR